MLISYIMGYCFGNIRSGLMSLYGHIYWRFVDIEDILKLADFVFLYLFIIFKIKFYNDNLEFSSIFPRIFHYMNFILKNRSIKCK